MIYRFILRYIHKKIKKIDKRIWINYLYLKINIGSSIEDELDEIFMSKDYNWEN